MRNDLDGDVYERNNVDEDYSLLQQSLLHDAAQPNDNYNSLLLPSFVNNSGSVKVFVEGVNNSIIKTAAKISAEHYIAKVTSERDAALKEARSYRNEIDGLRSKNRKLCCEMNDRIDVIRNFWRNNIAEGSTRGGLCVQNALRNNHK
jgi:hypothetical protein